MLIPGLDTIDKLKYIIDKYKPISYNTPINKNIEQVGDNPSFNIDNLKNRLEEIKSKSVFNPQSHYNNERGSLYKLAEELGLNHWEFDVLKRLVRCRKKGKFKEDLQKIKDTVDIYLNEYK